MSRLVLFFTLISSLLVHNCAIAGLLPPKPESNDGGGEDIAGHISARQFFGNGFNNNNNNNNNGNNAKEVMDGLHAQYASRTRELIARSGGACTAENISVRKEWGNMSAQERTAFISALKCMNTAPSRSPRGLDNNARNRWDDFTIAHNINTPTIHWSGLLMPWHRHYLSVLETTLRTECNYAGSLPYWDYAKYLSLPLSSNPLFDGSATSLGSTGHGPGNCITDGPLTDFVVNMPPPDPSSSARQKNPRCIKRNLSPNSVLAQYVSYERMTSVIRDSEDIVAFHQGLEGPDGLHPQPHTWVGGLQNNIYLAAQDPWFFLHHAMIDRVWVMWQMGDWEGRKGALDAGSWFVDRERLEFGALPPATLDTTLYLSPIFQNVTIREAMNPTGGALCYMYD